MMEFVCSEERIDEYYADAVRKINNKIKDTYSYRELCEFQTIKWGGTHTYRIIRYDYPIKIKNTDVVIMRDDLEHYCPDIDIEEITSGTAFYKYGSNKNSIGVFEEEEMPFEIAPNKEELQYILENIPEELIFYDKNKNLIPEEDMLLLFDENNTILSYEKAYTEALEELCKEKEN